MLAPMARFVLVPVALAVGLALAPPVHAAEPPYSKADYWAVADSLMPTLQTWWGGNFYVLRGGPSTRVNSAMLLTHAIAAKDGHQGLTRDDARARALVHRLTTAPAWLGARGRGPLTTCWSRDMHRVKRQHASLEPKVAEALAWAWRARAELRLSANAVDRIERTVTACARSRPWRDVRVTNQINWNAELYAAATTVSGRADLLRVNYRRQLAAFAADPANFGRGFQFHYRPDRPVADGVNLDTPEYANIVAHALGHYEMALRRGMRRLPASSMRRLRAWVTRLLAGSWTHAGYLNWDTGKGRRRWHSAQYWAFAQQGLLAIATSPRFWARPSHGRWAKAIFDRGLQLHLRRAAAHGGVAPKHMFGVHTRMEEYDCYCARMVANAARAVALDLGSKPFEDPPPLFAFDSDTGRLAVTTPRYSTAIVPDNRGVFPYGGIDPARLFGPGQTVAANVGGVPPAAFGVVAGGLASQHTRSGRLRLVHGPRAAPSGLRAGPFRVIEARGTVSRGRVRIRSSHRFRTTAIESRWRVTCAGGCRRRVDAHFPTWGAGAQINVVRRDGTRVPLTRRFRLSEAAALELGRGYRVVPLHAPRGATLVVVPVARQPTNPHPGPTLRIELARGETFRLRVLAVRIEPAP